MTNPTSNFGWQMPTPTDLVTDLPADFEVFGQAVDTSLADLQGGTTGQILAKASNTDMDFAWITNDVGDITAVNVTSPITGGGSSGDVTIGINAATTSVVGAVQLSDSTSTTSSVLASTPTATKAAYDLANTANTAAGTAQTTADAAYAAGFTNNFFAGKNKIINGKFDVWQRGTSFSSNGYTADRWFANFSGATGTVSQQTFTPGTAPAAGYEGTFFLRLATTVADDNSRVEQKIENVRTFAGQTVTVSLWAKADSARTITLSPYQSFGSGGSADVAIASQSISVTTAWTNFTKTFAIPSVSGKTIGTGSFLSLEISHLPNATFTLDIWGVQIEAGSVATPFQTASGSIQGELALCQRYYFQSENTSQYFWSGNTTNASNYYATFKLPITMRVAPTVTLTNRDESSFPATAGTAIRITTNSFVEPRTASATASGAYFGSSVIATSEL